MFVLIHAFKNFDFRTEERHVGLVSGSDLAKVSEQMGGSEDEVVKRFDFVFPENGLVAYKSGELKGKESIANFIGEEKIQVLQNSIPNLKYSQRVSEIVRNR